MWRRWTWTNKENTLPTNFSSLEPGGWTVLSSTSSHNRRTKGAYNSLNFALLIFRPAFGCVLGNASSYRTASGCFSHAESIWTTMFLSWEENCRKNSTPPWCEGQTHPCHSTIESESQGTHGDERGKQERGSCVRIDTPESGVKIRTQEHYFSNATLIISCCSSHNQTPYTF